MESVFSPAELRELSLHPTEKAVSALRRGDLRKADFFAVKLSTHHYFIYSGYLQWIARMLGHIYGKYGGEELHRCLRESISAWFRLVVERFQAEGFRSGVEFFCRFLRAELGTITEVREEADRLLITKQPCGSGGRLFYEGWYFRLPEEFPLIKEEHRLTGGRCDFPLFCSACTVMAELAREWAGRPLLALAPDPRRAGNPCRLTFFKNGSGSGKVFSDPELRKLKLSLMEQARTAIREENFEAARQCLERQAEEWKPLHDGFCLWAASIISFIYRNRGREEAWACVEKCYNPVMKPAFDLMVTNADRTNIEFIADVLHSHFVDFEVREEPERFCLRIKHCGSGGTLLREGRYGLPPLLSRIEKGGPETFSRDKFPAYCTHCAVTNRYIFARGGPYGFVVRPGNLLRDRGDPQFDPDDQCQLFYCKGLRGDSLEADLFEQVGLAKHTETSKC